MSRAGGSSDQTVAVRRAVRTACADIEPGQLVLVACSGGPDSVALAAACAWVARREGFRSGAVVVDHGLQDGSNAVAQEAADWCRRLGMDPVVVVPVEVGRAGGPEAAARDARYQALDEAADEHGAVAVLLGHSLEDQAETVLLRLARGSGARSLAAMAPVSGRWRRPLLSLPRSVVRAAADEALKPMGARPWQDPHNADRRYARVRARSLLEELEGALGPGVVAGLARTARLLRDDADVLDAVADETMARVSSVDDGLAVDIDDLLALPRAVRTRVIRRMCLDAGCPAEDLTMEHVETVEHLVSQWSGQGPTSLPGRLTASRAYGRLSIVRRATGHDAPGGGLAP